MDCILTNYPLSREFDQRLAQMVDIDVLKLNVTELRKRPLFKMLTYLRSLRVDRLFLPIEDENGSALLPVLKLLAAVAPTRKVLVVTPDLLVVPSSRMDALLSFASLVQASIVARWSVSKARPEVAALLRTEIAKVKYTNGKKVLYLNANLWFGVKAGGSVGHISGVVNAFEKKGYAVDFVSAGGRLMVKEQVRYSRLVPTEHFGLPWEHNYFRFHFDVVRQIQPLIAQHSFDFIYQRLSIANYSGVILSRHLNIPLILEYNGSEAWIARNWGRPLRQQLLAEQVEEANLRHAHLIVTISDVLRDELLSRGIPPERIVTYPNCFDPEVFNPDRYSQEDCAALRQRHGIRSDKVVVTFVGTFGQWHGAEVLARAIVLLIEQHNDWLIANKVCFLLVGDGSRMPAVKQILDKHATGPFVVLSGLVSQPEAPLYLAASDILVSPHVANADGSKFFGSPTKLFEYMAMGKAIIASDLDQIGEVLQSSVRLDPRENVEDATARGRVALLLKPDSYDQLAEGIIYLVEHNDMREVLGRNARKLALERYTWNRHVEKILAGFNCQ